MLVSYVHREAFQLMRKRFQGEKCAITENRDERRDRQYVYKRK